MFSKLSDGRVLLSLILAVALGACAPAGGDPASQVEVRHGAIRATTTYSWAGGSPVTMFPYTDGYCFVGSGNYGLNPGDGPATAYMTLDAHNNYVLTGVTRPAKIDWLQMGGDSMHAGTNTSETLISTKNVSQLLPLEGFATTGRPSSEMPPVFLMNVTTSNGVQDVGYVSSGSNLVAFDAHTGVVIWQSHGGVAAGSIPSIYTSAAIDPGRQFIYSVGRDGGVHKYAVGTGVESCATGCAVTDAHWPQVLSAKPTIEHVRTALTIGTAGGNTYLYAGTAGNDSGDYQGNVTAINISTGTQNVFNAMCSTKTGHLGLGACGTITGGGVWARAGVVFDPGTSRLLVATGNGYNNNVPQFSDVPHGQFADTLLSLNADGSRGPSGPIDSYTPATAPTWVDWDLGSTSPLVLPNNGSNYPNLAAVSGKDGRMRLINLANLSGQGKPGQVTPEGALFTMVLPTESTRITNCGSGGCAVTAPLARWRNPADGKTWVYVAAANDGLNALQLVVTNGVPSLVAKWQKSDAGGSGGGAFVANGVVYWADRSTLWALDATTGAILWQVAGGADGHQTPVVVNGVLYFSARAYGVNGRSFGTNGATSALVSKISATCVDWSNLNPQLASPGHVYISGTSPDYPDPNLPTPAPTPSSGFAANKSVSAPGIHQHFFRDAAAHMPASGTLASTDVIHVSYYLDPKDTPTEVAVQFQAANGNFWYRMIAGTDTGHLGTIHSAGPLVAPGQWGVMELTAGTLGLTNSYVKGISFVAVGGTAYFDTVAVSHGTYQIWIDDAPPTGAIFGPPRGYSVDKMVSGDNEGLDGEGWVWTTGWANGNTNKPLGATVWDVCQIAGVSGPWPLSSSPGRSVVLDWPGKSATFSGDTANTTATWKLHESNAPAGSRVATACADFRLEALISPGGFTGYSQALEETEAVSGFSATMKSLTLGGTNGYDASTSAGCALSGIVGGFLTPTSNVLRAGTFPDGTGQDLASFGNMSAALGVCYEPNAFGPDGY